MQKYIYLDSNAFWQMKLEHPYFDHDFQNLVQRLHQRYRFPISQAHFLDLAVSDKPGNEARLKRDLEFLSSASKGYVVTIDLVKRPPEEYLPTEGPIPGRGWILHHQVDDLVSAYRATDKNMPVDTVVQLNGTSHVVDLNQISDKHPYKTLLQENYGLYTPQVVEKYLQQLRNNRNDPKTYKEFRQAVCDELVKLGDPTTLLGHNTSGLEPLLEFLSAKGINEVTKTLVDATNVLLDMQTGNIAKLPWTTKIQGAYGLLDFHVENRDKIKKGNTPYNLHVDTHHLLYAAGANHLVTQDQAMAKKSEIVFKAYGIKSKVSTISDFKLKFD
jgi:hypothetical protein